MRFYRVITAAALMAGGLAAAGPVAAQGVHITPSVGVHLSGGDISSVEEQGNTVWDNRQGTFALGLALELGALRGSLNYATGARISERGVQGNIGDGSVLAAAADLVLRPLAPVAGFQPYVLGGIGLKHLDYSYDQTGLEGIFPKSHRNTAFHLGAGVDFLAHGAVGLQLEITDYITKGDGGWGRHDAFATAGLRVRL